MAATGSVAHPLVPESTDGRDAVASIASSCSVGEARTGSSTAGSATAATSDGDTVTGDSVASVTL